MKTTVAISLNAGTKLLVEEGDEINKHTAIYKAGDEGEVKAIPLSGILKVDASQIHKYLKRQLGDIVKQGELLAVKRSLLTQTIIKSPISGKIKEIDLKKGLLLMTTDFDKKIKKVHIPISGKVKQIKKDSIEIDVSGVRITGRQGSGDDQFGNLCIISASRHSVLDFGDEVADCVVFIEEAPLEAITKMDVLGALGVISTKIMEETGFPYLIIDDGDVKDILSHQGKAIWLRPEAQEVILPLE